MSSPLIQSGFILSALLLAGCTQQSAPPYVNVARTTQQRAAIQKMEAKHLPNAVRVHEKVISGGLPEGREAFQELRDLGIKTIISVDGAQPDVAMATQVGLRYVHLPHGYDGIPGTRAVELAKAVRDFPGPIYIHCHHGKHRSPAASAVACVGAGMISPTDALSVLQIAGTSEHYRGLFESARDARPVEEELLDKLKVEFPATAKLPVMAEAMVALEHTHGHLKALEVAGWRTPTNMPDLTADHQALLLREHYTELLRNKAAGQQPPGFHELLREGEARAQALEDALRKWAVDRHDNHAIPNAISSAFKSVNDNCKACHQQFRDVPLSEKR